MISVSVDSFNLNDFVTTITYIITGASLLLLGLKGLSQFTKTTKDDEFVGRLMTAFEKIEGLLRFLSLSPRTVNRVDTVKDVLEKKINKINDTQKVIRYEI